ncbi:hypothetical protein V8C86DRAFT_3130496, partial [Haematococcus lacustris]
PLPFRTGHNVQDGAQRYVDGRYLLVSDVLKFTSSQRHRTSHKTRPVIYGLACKILYTRPGIRFSGKYVWGVSVVKRAHLVPCSTLYPPLHSSHHLPA